MSSLVRGRNDKTENRSPRAMRKNYYHPQRWALARFEIDLFISSVVTVSHKKA